jgi:tRNA-dihydrouridine synthase
MQLILAPLRGITDYPFRTLFTRHFGGFDSAMAPFVTTVNAEKFTQKHLTDVLPVNNPSLALIPQILGNDPQHIVVMARALGELGYQEVNLNFGCPFVKVTRKQRGSGLLAFPDKIETIVQQLCSRFEGKVSIKVRLGLDQPTQLLELLPRLAPYPLASITVHARIATQMYEGSVNLEGFEQLFAHTTHPLIYNGDITSKALFEQLQQRFGTRVKGWMVGRGAVCDPFLPSTLRDTPRPAQAQELQRLRSFHDELYEWYSQIMYGPAPLLGRMKELWKHLGSRFEGSERVVDKICRCNGLNGYRELVSRLFGEGMGRLK